MLHILLITLLIVAICVALLGLRVFFVKGGHFPSPHVGESKAMRDRGIRCVQEQDREARSRHRFPEADADGTGVWTN